MINSIVWGLKTFDYNLAKLNETPKLIHIKFIVSIFKWIEDTYNSVEPIFNLIRDRYSIICCHSYGDVPLPVKGFKCWPYSGLIAIEQWGFFSVPHVLWHETSLYVLFLISIHFKSECYM